MSSEGSTSGPPGTFLPTCGEGPRRVGDSLTGLSWDRPENWTAFASLLDTVVVATGRTNTTEHDPKGASLIAWPVPDRVFAEKPAIPENLDYFATNVVQGFVALSTDGARQAEDIRIDHTNVSGYSADRVHFSVSPHGDDAGWGVAVVVVAPGRVSALIGLTNDSTEIPTIEAALDSVCLGQATPRPRTPGTSASDTAPRTRSTS